MALKFDNTIRFLKGLLFKFACSGEIRRYMALRAAVMHFVTDIGLYERSTLEALKSIIKPGASVIDVGANFGVYTLRLSKLVGPHGKVWAFEPIPMVFEQLKIRTASLKNVEVFNQALSDTDRRELNLNIPILFCGAPEPALASIEDLPPPVERIKIEVTNLDSHLAQITALDFIKVDVEGHESKFLEGSKNTILRFRPIIQFEENAIAQNLEWYQNFAEQINCELKFFYRGAFIALTAENQFATSERNFYYFPK